MNYLKQNTADQNLPSKILFSEEVCELIGLEVSSDMIEKSILWYLQRLKPSTRVQIVSDYLSYHSAELENGEEQ